MQFDELDREDMGIEDRSRLSVILSLASLATFNLILWTLLYWSATATYHYFNGGR